MRYYTRIVKKYNAGDTIFSENTDSDGMYIVDSGRVRIFKTVGTDSEKKEIELCTLGPRSMFGEMAMIDEKKRSASVEAIEPTECTVITKKIFEDQLAHIPVWMVNMIKILVQRLRETNDKLRGIIEQYTTPPDDMGSILTVEEKEQKAAAGALDATAARGANVKTDEIIEELFDEEKEN